MLSTVQHVGTNYAIYTQKHSSVKNSSNHKEKDQGFDTNLRSIFFKICVLYNWILE